MLFRELSGVSADVVARAGKTAFREAALFTHRGLSGPAILQISSYWREGEEIGDRLPARTGRGLGAGGEAGAAEDAFPHPARRIAAGPARRGAGQEDRPVGRARQSSRRRSSARPQRRLADWRFRPERQRRLRQGRGDRRRNQHRRPLLADDGGQAPSPASTRSARRSTSPAGWVAIISNGHGLVGGRPAQVL